MTHAEIRTLYEEHGSDSFEMFNHESVDIAEVEIACGPEAAEEYSFWVYRNLK